MDVFVDGGPGMSSFAYGQVNKPLVNEAMQLLREISEIGESTSFNGISLMNSAQTLTFKVGDSSNEDISINLKKLIGGWRMRLNSDGIKEYVNFETDAEFSDLEGFDDTPEHEPFGNLGYVTAINNIDNAIAVVISEIQNVRSTQERLANRKEFIDTKNEKVEAVRSTYEDADFAKEQMELMKVQILQQTATAALAQANSAPQSVLSLFR